jgi:hypothetical protein
MPKSYLFQQVIMLPRPNLQNADVVPTNERRKEKGEKPTVSQSKQ